MNQEAANSFSKRENGVGKKIENVLFFKFKEGRQSEYNVGSFTQLGEPGFVGGQLAGGRKGDVALKINESGTAWIAAINLGGSVDLISSFHYSSEEEKCIWARPDNPAIVLSHFQ